MSAAKNVLSASNVRAAWGESAPDWVVMLAQACDRTSQKAVADKMNYSSTVINQVLKGVYTGNLTAVEKAARGALMNVCVACPVLGELPGNRCLEIQRQPFASTNPQRVRLYRACRAGCAHSNLGRES